MFRHLFVNLIAMTIRNKAKKREFRRRYKKPSNKLIFIEEEKLYYRKFKILVLLGKRINYEAMYYDLKSRINAAVYKLIRPLLTPDTVCYTCIIGNYTKLCNHAFINPGWDYVCFTDNQEFIKKKHIGVWQIKPLVFDKLDNTKNNRWHKLNPHLLFPEYKKSLYLDGNLRILTSYYSSLVGKAKSTFLFPEHVFNCIYEHLDLIEKVNKETKENLNRLRDKYEKEKMPRKWGLTENNMIFRKHHDPEVISLMEQWWHMVENYSRRDQASLMYILWKNNVDLKSHTFPNVRFDTKNCLVMKQNYPVRGKTILITGGAGFIGSTLADKILQFQNKVIVIDNFADFYSPAQKENNIQKHLGRDDYKLYRGSIEDADFLNKVFAENEIDMVVHIAARAGIRSSILNPAAYMKTNVEGTINILEAMRERKVKKIVFASSSSVYGNCRAEKFSETMDVTRPISPYASSKIACEQSLYTYSRLYKMQAICLRFFTVYGPRQRPDLAIRKFIELIREDKPIPVYGDGTTERDYTYIDDIVSGIMLAMQYTDSRYSIFNLGNGRPISLNDMIKTIEKVLGRKARIDRQPMQPGDVRRTSADISKARRMLGYEPTTGFEDGIKKYLEWSDAQNKQ